MVLSIAGRFGEWNGSGFLGPCKPLPISHSLWTTIPRSIVYSSPSTNLQSSVWACHCTSPGLKLMQHIGSLLRNCYHCQNQAFSEVRTANWNKKIAPCTYKMIHSTNSHSRPKEQEDDKHDNPCKSSRYILQGSPHVIPTVGTAHLDRIFPKMR